MNLKIYLGLNSPPHSLLVPFPFCGNTSWAFFSVVANKTLVNEIYIYKQTPRAQMMVTNCHHLSPFHVCFSCQLVVL